MADSPFSNKVPEKRPSLAEMAARAAQRTSRPPPSPSTPPSSRSPGSMAPRAGVPYPPSPSYAPPPSMGHSSTDSNGSGLINLSHISQAPTLAPAVRAIDPHTVTPATPVATPLARSSGGGSRMVLAGVVVALVGIGVAYGLTAQNGSDAPTERAAAVAEPVQALPAANAAPVAAPVQPKVEAPTAAAPVAAAPARIADKGTVNTPPGAVAPAEATEITRPAVARTGKAAKGARKGNGAPAVAAAAAAPAPAAAEAAPTPGAGAAAIAAAMAAEGVPAAAPQPAPVAAPPVAKAAPAPAAPEPTGLAGAIKKAVGPTGPAPEAEKAAPPPPPVRGDIPELPAQGAIQGALGGPRAAAKNCIVGQEAPSRATIVFAPTGSVQTVTVSGPAAGTPAEACIKTALSKAAVGPFKHASFSVSTTISP